MTTQTTPEDVIMNRGLCLFLALLCVGALAILVPLALLDVNAGRPISDLVFIIFFSVTFVVCVSVALGSIIRQRAKK